MAAETQKQDTVAQLSKALAPLMMTVLPSSVCPGFGVYALRRIPIGTIIGEYPGQLITDEDDTLLRELLHMWKSESKPSKDKERIALVADRFGVEIVPYLPATQRYQAAQRMPAGSTVNWRSVLKELYAYSFQTDAGTLVPSRISFTGAPLYDMDAHEESGDYSGLTPFFNEAPPGRFQNLLTNKTQNSVYSIDVSVEEHHVYFYTKRNIMPGSELFFFYGPSYDRKYPINMLPEKCGWGLENWENSDEEEKTYNRKFYENQRKFRKPIGVQNLANSKRRLEMTVNCNILLAGSS